MRWRSAVPALFVVALVGACEDKPKTNPFENPAAPKKPPPITEAPKPEGPPEITIGSGGPKVGWSNILLEKADGPAKLRAELVANKEYIAGKTVKLTVDRQAKLAWVIEMTRALDETGAAAFENLDGNSNRISEGGRAEPPVERQAGERLQRGG